MIEVLAPAWRVSAPVLEMLTGPKLVVIRLPLIAKAAPVREIPPAPVLRLPSVVSPVPADWVIDAAVIAVPVTFPAFVMVRVPIPALTTPPKTRFPVLPKFRVRFWGPFTVLEKVMLLPFVDVSKLVLPLRVTAEAIETLESNTDVPARVTVPAPVCVKGPEIEPMPVPPTNVKVPVLVT